MGETRGFVLMAVLWITAMLSILALGYASTARIKGLLANNGAGWMVERYQLASGVVLGAFEYEKYKLNKSLMDNKEEVEAITEEPLELWYPRFEPYEGYVGGDAYLISLRDVSGRLNVNSMKRDLLVSIVEACGMEEEEAEAVADAVQDWIDTDQNHRLNGAETDYYEGLEPPYPCKDAELQNIEELLLIKGVTRDLYTGNETVPGLKDFLDVAGDNSKMDVNAASPKAFSLVKDLPPEAVEGILEKRREAPISKMDDLLEIVPQKYFSDFGRYFDVAPSGRLVVRAARKAPDGQEGAFIERTMGAAQAKAQNGTRK